jgi:hypothetical protein
MQRLIGPFISLLMVGCLQPVWADGTTTSPVSTSRNGAPPEIVDPDAEDANDTDRYRISFPNADSHPWGITFYASNDESYSLDCRWQADNCLGFLPEGARDSYLLTINMPRRLCTRIRIFRDDEELGVVERFRWGCGFVLDVPMESPP